MAKRATSIDVARKAGVSQSTVSRVFGSNGAGVSEEKRQRVLSAAAALDYHPSAVASSLSRQSTNIAGIVVANITSPFYPYVLEKLLQRLQQMSYQALVFTVPPDSEVDDLLPLVFQNQVDALIVTSATLSSSMAEKCYDRGIPVILFNRYVTGLHVNAVCCDNLAGGRLVADVLLDTGHQRLAYIAGTPNTSTNSDRQQGFNQRLIERGYSGAVNYQADFSYSAGYEAARDLLSRVDRPDALFCSNDIMALGAMDAARAEFGLSIPDDLSVIGFDDIPMASWQPYALTTIRQEVDPMIDETMALMVDKLDDPESAPHIKLVPGTLQVRSSVRGLK